MATAAVLTEPTPKKTADTPLMEFVVDRNHFLAEVTAASRASELKTTQPMLTHLLFEADGGMLTITGSGQNRTLTTECPAAVKTPGKAAVPAQKLVNYLKLLPAVQVTIRILSNHQVFIAAGRSRTKMPGLAPNSFPATPSPSAETVRLSSRGLKTLIRQSLFSVANSEDRYLFNAALLLLRQDRMGMVATDGRRLSLVEVSEESLAVGDLRKVLLPKECLSDLLSLFGSNKDESVEFSEDEKQLFFRIGTRLFVVRKLIGSFPNYEAILPREVMKSVVTSVAELMTSVQRVLEFADEKSSAVKMRFENNALTISASSADRGESHEMLPLSYTEAPITIGFNGYFIAEFLKTLGGEGEVRIALKDGSSAAVITPEAFNPEFQQKYVVMPMRI